MTSKWRPGASQNGSGDQTLSKNARLLKLIPYTFWSLPKDAKNKLKKNDFGTEMGQNASGTRAFFQTKIETNATLLPCWCFLVLEGASGRDFHRFSVGFGMNSGCFSKRFCSNSWAAKLAKNPLTHPLQTFSKPIFGPQLQGICGSFLA